MARAWFRFYAELNDFLPPERRFTEFAYDFLDAATVKDRIEAFGVPHTEVDLILINGVSRGFDWRVQDGDRISVYPIFEAFDIAELARLRPEPLRNPCFVLDVHLGKLATYLRMAGFDALYSNHNSDEQLAAISSQERRTLLTRDIGLLKRSQITHGYFVRQTAPRLQLAEVVARFDLGRLARPFTRCLRCNGVLERWSREKAAPALPDRTLELYDEFQSCVPCGRI